MTDIETTLEPTLTPEPIDVLIRELDAFLTITGGDRNMFSTTEVQNHLLDIRNAAVQVKGVILTELPPPPS